jgi:hypothetical protein
MFLLQKQSLDNIIFLSFLLRSGFDRFNLVFYEFTHFVFKTKNMLTRLSLPPQIHTHSRVPVMKIVQF